MKTKEELFDQFIESIEYYGATCYHEGSSWGYNSYEQERSEMMINLVNIFNQALDYQSDTQSISN